MSTTPQRLTTNEYLRIYLNDHRAGATGGARLAQRCLDNNSGSELARFLTGFIDGLHQDSATLDEVMNRFGVRRNPFKQALATIAERFARLKLNGHLRGYSPLSRVVELEGLISGVYAKQRLWVALPTTGDFLSAELLEEMKERADQQLQGLLEFHRTAAAGAFASASSDHPGNGED